MSKEEQQSELQTKLPELERRTSELRSKVQGLTNAATADMMGKVDEVETMLSALKRDVGELDSDHGASSDTVTELASVVESKLSSLEHEIEALSLGNPTTISAAVDALMDAGDTK